MVRTSATSSQQSLFVSNSLFAVAIWIVVLVLDLQGALTLNLCAQSLKLRVQHRVGQSELVLEKASYQNALSQTYTVDRLRYYISNLRLHSGATFSSDSTWLVDEDDSASKSISIKHLPAGRYSSVEFLIGVDSAHNTAGLQEGALDPVRGMFWAWNTGYIFFKLDGHSPQSSAAGHMLEYHIGGFRGTHNALRTVRLDFPQALDVQAGQNLEINLVLQLDEFFRAVSSINFQLLPTVTDLNANTQIADNYQHCFQLADVRVVPTP